MARNGRIGPTGNARSQEQLRAAEKLAQSQRTSDLREVMSSPAGRRFIWDLIDRRANSHGTGYSASGSEMYMLCGQRSVGVELREDVKRLDVALYAKMMLEAIEAADNQRIQSESAQSKADELDDESEE